MRVVSLHSDVLVATSRIWQTTCTIVRGRAAESTVHGGGTDGGEVPHPVVVRTAGDVSGEASLGEARSGDETFVIDSPILPDELEVLPALVEQSRFPQPAGLLVTHADWDHLLARLAFPDAAVGVAETSATRMRERPGDAQRELRTFDDQHYVQRPTPLALGSVQALDVPGGCEIGSHELAMHPTEGHTADGMAVWIPWAGVLVAGDYLSTVEIPVLGEGASIESYLATLQRLRPLVAIAEHVVPGHGPVLDAKRASAVLEQDVAYLTALRDNGASAGLPDGRRTKAQRTIHAHNVERLAG